MLFPKEKEKNIILQIYYKPEGRKVSKYYYSSYYDAIFTFLFQLLLF